MINFGKIWLHKTMRNSVQQLPSSWCRHSKAFLQNFVTHMQYTGTFRFLLH